MVRLEDLEEEKLKRYLGLIDSASDELATLLELLSLAARIEGNRYEPVTREADSLELAPAGATGTGTTVVVEPDAVERSLASLQLAAARHGGIEVKVTVDGPNVVVRARRRERRSDRPRRRPEGPGCGGRRDAGSLARRRGRPRRRAADRHVADELDVASGRDAHARA